MTEDRKTLEAIRDEVFAARTKDGRRVPQPWHRLHELTGGIFFRREIMGDDKNSLETRETFYHLLRFSRLAGPHARSRSPPSLHPR